MHSFYFGDSKKPLYGVIHHPNGGEYRNSAILICNSVGHEYIRCHRELKRLADKLSQLGYYVMRFDYSGVGDSAGEFDKTLVSDWQNDVNLAYEELKAISGQQQIDCIGVRMGGGLALTVSQWINFSRLFLWDPVTNGKELFTKPLDKLQDELLKSHMWFSCPRNRKEIPANELLGYLYSKQLLQQLDQMVFTNIELNSYVQYFFLFTNVKFKEDNLLKITLENSNYIVESIDDIGNWDELEYIDTSLTANHILIRLIREFE